MKGAYPIQNPELLADAASPKVWLRNLVQLAGFVCMLSMIQLPSVAADQEQGVESPAKVKAAFLRNFARYVRWPTNAFEDASSSWRIGVLGSDPFGGALESTLRGRTEQGRSFQVFRAAALGGMPSCHIVFIAEKESEKRRAALMALKGKPVLTVGESPGFLDEGGIVRFQVGKRVEMSINLDQARSVSLKVPSQMLEVSREVLENGKTRKVK